MDPWYIACVKKISAARTAGPLTVAEAGEIVRQHSLLPIPAEASDNDWVESLIRSGEHEGINIWAELRRYQAWAAHKDNTASRKGFERWLDNSDAPLNITARELPAVASLPEPPRWKERIVAAHPDCIYAPGKIRANDRWNELPKDSQQLITWELKSL